MAFKFFDNFVPTNTTTPSSTGYKGTRYVNPEDANALTNYRYKKTDWSYLNAAPTPLINKGDLFTYKSNEEQTEFAGQGKEDEPYKASFGSGAKAISLSLVKGAWDWIGNTLEYFALHDTTKSVASEGFKPIDVSGAITELRGENYNVKEEDLFYVSNVAKGMERTPEQIQQQRASSFAPIKQVKENVSSVLAKEAELEKQPGWVQFAGNLVESTPYTVASRLPFGTGMILNFGAMYTASYNQKLAEKKARGEPITEEDLDSIETYAAGAALVEAASEQIFRLGALKFAGKAGSKATAQALKAMPTKKAISYIAKYWVKNGLEEGAEEIISEIGQGTVAKFTTDKDAPWWDESNPDSILTAKDVGLAGLGGFVMGATLTTINTKAVYNEFEYSKQMYEEVKDIPLEALTADIQARGKEAVLKDLSNSHNRKVVATEIKNEIAKADEISSVDSQIERYENININLSNLVSTATTPQEMAIYKEAKQRVTNSLNQARKVKSETRRTGSPYTPQQIESMMTNAKKSIAEDKSELRETTSNEIRGALQENIAVFEAQVLELEAYKRSYSPEFEGKDISMQTKKEIKALPKAVRTTRAYEYGVFETAPSQYTIMRKSRSAPSGVWQALPSADSRNKTYETIEVASRALYAPATASKEVAPESEQVSVQDVTTEKMSYEQAQMAQSEALAKESQRANPRMGVENILEPYARPPQDNSEKKQLDYKSTMSKETKERIDAARVPAKNMKLFRNKVQEFFKNPEYRAEVIRKAKIINTYGAVKLERKYGDILRTWRKLQKSNGLASSEATKIVSTIYSQVQPEKLELFFDAIIYADVAEDIRHNTFTPGRFGIETKGEALATNASIQNELRKPENAMLVELLEVRKEQMNKVRDELISLAAEAGLDFSYIKDGRYDYVYHAILEFTPEFTGIEYENFKKKTFVAYEKRKGSEKDYISNPFYADWMILFNMNKNMAYLELYREVKKQDVSKKYGKDEHGNLIVPDGYDLLDPSCFRIKQFDEQSTKNMMAKAYEQIAKENVLADSARGREIMRMWEKKANRVTLVVPSEIVTAINKEFAKRPENEISKTARWLTKKWKFMQIRLPHRVIKYNIRNATGDFDAVFAGKASVLKPSNLFPAISDLVNYFKNGTITNPLLHEYIRRMGMTSSQTLTEMNELMEVANVRFAKEKNVTKAAKYIWKEIITLESFTDFREQILRYAAFTSWVQEMNNTKNGLPNNYGASYKEEIDSIESLYDRAVKLSNDLLGAYDDVGPVGTYLSDHIFPFLRFRVLNFKRYIKLYENAIFNNGKNDGVQQAKSILGKIGNTGRVSGVAAFRIAKLTAKITASMLVYSLLNNMFAGDEEDELPGYVKETPHITIPRVLTKWTGTDRIYYIAGLGSFQDMMNMFGLDMSTGKDMIRIVNGEISVSDWAAEAAKESALDWINSSMPFAKLLLAYTLGVDYYPDASNPREIRDKMEYTMKQVGLDNEWRALNGMPIQSGNIFTEKMDNLLNSTLPGDASVYDVNEMIEDFMIENNYSYKPYESSKDVSPDSLEARRSSAAYNYKLALKLGDKNAAEKYLIEYAYYGGTSNGIATSIRKSLVYTNLSPEEKAEFKASLTPDEMVTLERYFEYAEWLTDEAIEGFEGQS